MGVSERVLAGGHRGEWEETIGIRAGVCAVIHHYLNSSNTYVNQQMNEGTNKWVANKQAWKNNKQIAILQNLIPR